MLYSADKYSVVKYIETCASNTGKFGERQLSTKCNLSLLLQDFITSLWTVIGFFADVLNQISTVINNVLCDQFISMKMDARLATYPRTTELPCKVACL
jgi:hypothetical protein